MSGADEPAGGARPLPLIGLRYSSNSCRCCGTTYETQDASSPHWERALSLNEPKASLGKEGEGPAPTRRDSRTQSVVGECCFVLGRAGPSPSLPRLASLPRQTSP